MKILLPEKKMRSNSVKIKNLRVSKTGRISISNYNSNIIKEKIRQIRQSMISYNMSNLMKSNELITNTKKYINKKSLILSLKEDLDYHQKIFDSYQAYEQYAGGICKAYKKNYEDIFIYKNDLAEASNIFPRKGAFVNFLSKIFFSISLYSYDLSFSFSLFFIIYIFSF